MKNQTHFLSKLNTKTPAEKGKGKMSGELLPCPFCGGEAEDAYLTSGCGRTVKCKNRDCAIYNMPILESRWQNTRMPPSGGEEKEAFVKITCRCNSKFGLGLRKNDTEVCTFQDHGHGWAETFRMPLKDSKIPEVTPQEIVIDDFKEQT